jgi:hypothetical protein
MGLIRTRSRPRGLGQRLSGRLTVLVTKNGVPPKWRHTRSVGQSIAGRVPGWSGPSRVNNKQLTTMDIVAEYMEYSKS